MQSKAKSVSEYLAELPPHRREAVATVRKVILENLNNGFEEGMTGGMIGYFVPHRLYPPGYHCNPEHPLPFAGLASQKNYMSVYLMTVYGDDQPFRDRWAKTGKKLDMGKCCVRFRKLDDLALDVIGAEIRRVSVERYVEIYEAGLKTPRPAKRSRAGAPARPRRNASPTKPRTTRR